MSAYEVSIISIVGINVILAVSLNMISGFCGQVSLGHGAFFGAGAYAAALAMVATASVPLALMTALVTGSLLGIVVGFASLRVRSDFLAVTTIGVNFLFTGFVRKQAWLGGEMGIQRNSPDRARRLRQHDYDPVVRRLDHCLELPCQPVLDGFCLPRGRRG